jgi:phosphatidylglycerol:prolipoprotein diacylglycerol transferase
LIPSPANPVAFQIANVGIRWYAIFILAGIVAAVILIRQLAERRGLDPEFPLDAAPWMIVGGILGARLTYVLLRFDHFVANPADALNIRLGGLAIHGALAGGGLVLWWCCRSRRQSLLTWADLIVAGVALGQAIGRWGNWANQEAFGRPTDLPWGLSIAPDRRPERYAEVTAFHPTFLYESVFNLANAALLSWIALAIGRGRLRPGDGLWTYCVTYGIGRLLIEGLRLDSLYVGPLPGAYWVSFGLIALGTTMLVIRHAGGAGKATTAATGD